MSIALEHVNYIYSPGTAYEKRALNDISLEIGQGQFVGIIGHTGSGKSTLIQHLNGLMKATSGDIRRQRQMCIRDRRWTKHLCGRVRHEKTAQSGRSCVSVS